MEILVIDGQGGGLGRQLVAAVKKAVPQAVVTAIGTNSAATSAMLKAGGSPPPRRSRRWQRGQPRLSAWRKWPRCWCQ